MKELTGHWKKQYDKNYLGSWSIVDGQEPTMTIDRLERKDVDSDKGTENHLVIFFKEDIEDKNLPLILNSTNADLISKVAGTPNIEEWSGTVVELYVDHNVKAFGSIVDGLRIRKPKPKKKVEEMTPKHPKWEAAKSAVKNGTTKDGLIGKGYSITDANFELLCKE